MTSTRTWIALAVAAVALTPAGRGARADDAGCLVVAAWGEARGEPLPVIEAVVSTIVNRARARGLSVCDAVMDPAAFTGVTPAMHELFVEAAKPKGPEPITEQPHTGHDRAQLAAVEAAAVAALAGQLPDRTNGATHFYSPAGMRELGMKSAPAWASTMVRTATLGPFIFLREKKVAAPVMASVLPPAAPIVTWGDPTADGALGFPGLPDPQLQITGIELPSATALAAGPEVIDFGTLDIVAAARPSTHPVFEIEPLGLAAAANPMPDILASSSLGPDIFAPGILAPNILAQDISASSSSSTPPAPNKDAVDLRNLDLATSDAEDAAVARASAPLAAAPLAIVPTAIVPNDPSPKMVAEDDAPILENWRESAPIRRLKTRIPDLATMVDIQPLATVAEEPETELAADTTDDDGASPQVAAVTAPVGNLEAERRALLALNAPASDQQTTRETDQQTGEQIDDSTVVPPQDIRPGAAPWPRTSSSVEHASVGRPDIERLPPAPVPPRGRLSTVSAWSPPGDVEIARSDTPSEWDAPFPSRGGASRNLRFWSPEPGTLLACRGPYRGAILVALHGTRVPRQVIDRIRCGE